MSANDSNDKTFRRLAAAHEIPAGGGRAFEVNGVEIALFNDGGEFRALSNSCPHRGAPLDAGLLRGGKVYCPWHCFDFDLKTGACGAVEGLDVETYEVKVEGDAVLVRC
jgi:nitrite reductase (NADH) small subunit